MAGIMWASVKKVSREGDFTLVTQITLFISCAVGCGVPFAISSTYTLLSYSMSPQ